MHLAQLNVARAKGHREDPGMRGFFDNVEHVNAMAESAPGFVWRLKDESGDATDIRVFNDPLLLVNLSVWASHEALHAFVYESDHMRFVRQRTDWFERPTEAHTVLWWVQPGHTPSLEEAWERLTRLRTLGATPEAFTFRSTFPPPSDGAQSTGNQ